MKRLLIIGAGGHGQVVKDIAVACGYNPQGIDFLDDSAPNTVGKIDEAPYIAPNYDSVIIAIGNNTLRTSITEKVERCDCVNIATLVHPAAYASPTAVVGKGTVVGPNAVINTNCRIGEGCIISAGAIVDHDSSIGYFSHINAGAVCMAGSKIEKLCKVNAGEIIQGI